MGNNAPKLAPPGRRWGSAASKAWLPPARLRYSWHMAQVMVLAAGHGTRLGRLTQELPKPLVPVGDRAILRHICDQLHALGQQQVVINTHHLPETFDGFDSGETELLRVHEPELRGTAGGVFGARAHLESPVVVYNADIWTEAPFEQLMALGRQQPIGLLVAEAKDSGTIGIDSSGRVVRLRGQRFGEEVCGVDYVGISVLGEQALAALPERGCLVGDLFLPWLQAGRPIQTLMHTEPWDDLGTPAAYLEQNRRWLAARGLRNYIAHDAQVPDQVQLQEVVVGRGSRVRGQGKLERCVIWSGAEAIAPLADSIVTSSGQVVSVVTPGES